MSAMEDYMQKPCFFNSKFTNLKAANLNIQTHALQYGTACIGGIRGYWNAELNDLLVFRIKDHYKRFIQSSKILQMNLPYTVDRLIEISIELLKKGTWKENVYLRPIQYKSSYDLTPVMHSLPDQYAIYAIPLNDYLDTNRGLEICISSWLRLSDNQIPMRSKASAGYLNSALAKSEAVQNGYDEAIFLDVHSNVCEGSAENIFIVRDGVLITPPISSSILEGITRKTILQLANDLGIPVEERNIERTELYICDEAFFSGTGAQVAWIKAIDKRVIHDGKQGNITRRIHDLFFSIVTGKEKKYSSWITSIYK